MTPPAHLSFPTLLQTLAPNNASLTNTILPTLVSSLYKIAQGLRTAHTVTQLGSTNTFGDSQLNVDVLAENVVREACAACTAISTASSEEDPVERAVVHNDAMMPTTTGNDGEEEEKYSVAFDPLDGSSIIAPNWSVGTIIGVWKDSSALGGNPKTQLVATIVGVLGPRTSAFVGVRVPGSSSEGQLMEVGVGDDGEITVIRENVKLSDAPFKTRYFAPANLRAAAEVPEYMELVNHYIRENYTLRYSGGLVPDVAHALVKGHGIYLSPVTGGSKPKLRRLYELCPTALAVECAGGKALDEAGVDVLEKAVQDVEERGGLIAGTAEEVERAVKMLLQGA